MNPEIQIYLDGNLVPASEAKVSVYDHGFLYGDGVFEGLRVYNRRIFRLDAHLERLYRSAKAIWLSPPFTQNEMGRAIEGTVAANKLENGYIRAIFSRGVGDLGLDPRKCSKPTTIIIADGIKLYPPEVYEEGMECITVSTRRNRPDTLSPQIKSLNYLNNILAKIESIRAGVPECIMLNEQGFVAECSADNIFIVHEDLRGRSELRTPPITAGALEGITRDAVMELAEAMGLKVAEKNLTLFDLYNAREAFLTGSGAEVVPMTRLDMREIGDGKPGAITKKLMAAYVELRNSEGQAAF
ncbi:branched chain amino acid aminotransferase apoenzyme [Abditibacterium utsteinense]|uniref:Branched-chain-amino-acid aminotransferase n=1 Tax=Abditibacterium utsteinense TaxID=1960156 RepID=A0A2S8SSY3_9BACT|nr:branched-chain-amino-acid transaminase [Abditibacterium utsteinense]PQV63913.1 branched chain amino acid aminotransferase apoenzyme [Abditibacterium utsteinense]